MSYENEDKTKNYGGNEPESTNWSDVENRVNIEQVKKSSDLLNQKDNEGISRGTSSLGENDEFQERSIQRGQGQEYAQNREDQKKINKDFQGSKTFNEKRDSTSQFNSQEQTRDLKRDTGLNREEKKYPAGQPEEYSSQQPKEIQKTPREI